MNKKLLWLLPASLLAIGLGTLLALPGFVAAQSHRPAMERFASALTGRDVHIDGKLTLTILPRPELSATRITINGPDNEVISAKALSLDISVPALLRGQLAVQTLNLDRPVIAFPWPLPGGPRAVAPPPWLAALHAHLANASISLGGLAFTQISADLFTGPGGTVSVSGNGALLGQAVTLSLALGRSGLDGAAPLSAQANAGQVSANFTGTLDGTSAVSGQIGLSGPDNIAGNATLTTDATQVVVSSLALGQGAQQISGSASFNLVQPALRATLLGQNLNLDRLGTLPAWVAALPADVTLSASNVTLLGQNFPALAVSLTAGPVGVVVRSLNLSLPGGGQLTGSGAMAGGGQLTGQLNLTVPDSTALLAAYHLPANFAEAAQWPSAHLTATLGGSAAQPLLQDISGTLGTDHVSGDLVLSPGRAAGQLAFDHLALAPLAGWAGLPLPGAFTAELEVSAARAEAGPVKLSNLALDAAFDGTLNVRRVSASLYGGLAAGSFALDASGCVTSAQGFVDIPSAAPLAALLPPAYAPPPALLTGRFNLVFAASGPADALAASAVARLVTRLPDPKTGKMEDAGDLTLTAAPVIDLTHGSARGALSVQYPEAILLARFFGVDQGLVFPGAGSASLRARFTASASQYGLNDFVANFGTLNATGRVLVLNGVASGQIDAGSLLLPPVPVELQFPESLPLQGKLSITARQIFYAGNPLLGPSAGSLSWSGSGAALDVTQAGFGGGNISGRLGMALSSTAAPAFTATLLAQNIDAGAIALPLPFPYPITAGTLSASTTLTASGYGLKSVMATLGGTASLSAAKGVLRGFDLGRFADTLGTPDALHGLYRALVSGGTPFSALNLAATLDNGNCTLTSASLDGPAGHVSGTGGIDLYDNAQALRLVFVPSQVSPPVSATLLVLGTWAVPRHIAHMKAALEWKPAAPPPITH